MFIKINRVVLAVGSKNNGLNHLGALAQDMLGIPPDYSIAMKHASTLLPRPPAPVTTLVGEWRREEGRDGEEWIGSAEVDVV